MHLVNSVNSVDQFRAELNDQLGTTLSSQYHGGRGPPIRENDPNARPLLVGRTFHAFPSVFTLCRSNYRVAFPWLTRNFDAATDGKQ